MEPIKTPETNTTLVGAEGDDEVQPLPARVENGESISVWQLSFIEREQLMAGAHITLAVAATRPPPVALVVTPPYTESGERMEWSARLGMYISSEPEDEEEDHMGVGGG